MSDDELRQRATMRAVRMDKQRRWELTLVVALAVLLLASTAALWLGLASISRTVDAQVDRRNEVICAFLRGLSPASHTAGLVKLHNELGCKPPLAVGQ